MKNRFMTCLLTSSALIISLASCQQKEDFTPNNGVLTDVTISVAAPQGLQLKSNTDPGNGSEINRCILEIYDASGNLVGGERLVSAVTDISNITFSARLVSGESYDFLFWADCANGTTVANFADNHYNTTDLKALTVLGDYTNNDDSRDAFFCGDSRVFDGSADLNFELKRPFGQLSIVANDVAAATAVNPADVTAKVSFSNVATTINLLDGSLSGSGNWEPTAASAPVALATDGRLSFDYIFAPAAQQTLVTMTVEVFNNEAPLSTYNSSNIPVRRNYRTKVSGDFLTDATNINVGIVTNPDGDVDEIATGLNLYTPTTTNSDVTAGSTTIAYTVETAAGVTIDESGVAYRAAGTDDPFVDVAASLIATRASLDYEVELTGLASSTAYEYKCYFKIGSERHESTISTFTTSDLVNQPVDKTIVLTCYNNAPVAEYYGTDNTTYNKYTMSIVDDNNVYTIKLNFFSEAPQANGYMANSNTYVFNATDDQAAYTFNGTLSNGSDLTDVPFSNATMTELLTQSNYSIDLTFTVGEQDYQLILYKPITFEDKTTPVVPPVEEPTAPQVGDYYYSDGTWSTTLDNTKTPIAVVFWVGDASTEDPKLEADFPSINFQALAISLTSQYTQWGWRSTSISSWAANNSSIITWENTLSGVRENYTSTNVDKMRGYANTAVLLTANSTLSIDDAELYATTALSNFPTTPETSSGWFIPSGGEAVKTITSASIALQATDYDWSNVDKTVMNTVNTAIEAVSGVKLGTQDIWLSHERNGSYENSDAFYQSTSGRGTTAYSGTKYVRPIIAF